MDRPRVLFVDDEANVLAGLRTVLRGQRAEWDMAFVDSGKAALEEFDKAHFDVVVTDMRMPKMDGSELLTEIKQRSAKTVRIVLSGQTDIAVAMRTVFVAHQFLAKPCSATDIRSIIRRTIAHNALMGNAVLQAFVGKIDVLPPAPQTFIELTKAMTIPDVSLSVIGKIVEADPALSSKLLQLVNSAFFGLGRKVSSASEAASLLGLSTLRNLALAIGALEHSHACPPDVTAKLAQLRKHSLLTAEIARALATLVGLPAHQAFTIGVLHDIGDMVLAMTKSKQAEGAQLPDSAAIGAYLLGVWGLPVSITEAVAHHHHPEALEHDKVEILDVLHVASALAAAAAPNPFEDSAIPNIEHLHAHGVTESQWAEWKAQAATVMQNSEHTAKA